jgi:hypothetical protein
MKLYLKNATTKLKHSPILPIQRVARTSSDETVEHIQQARIRWEQGLLEELGSIVAEAKRPFLLIREPGKVNPFLSAPSSQHINSGSNADGGSVDGGNVAPNNPAPENIKFLYDSEDLMETMLNIKNPNFKNDYLVRATGLVKLPIRPADYNTILKKFADLTYPYSQLSVEELHLSTNNAIPLNPGLSAGNSSGNQGNGPAGSSSAPTGFKFLTSRHDEAEYLILHGNMQEAQNYLKRGCPPTLRFKLWRLACGLQPDKPSIIEEQLYSRLRIECDRLDLVTDELFMYDIQTILDDPRFFVFEEELKEMVFCFSRDSSVRDSLAYEIHAPLMKQMGVEFPLDTSAPPSSVLPYLGFTTYFAPLCYLSRSRIMLYSLSKFLFCFLWSKINVFSSDSDTLIHLCKTFEHLLWTSNPKLFLHLVSINLHPIKVIVSQVSVCLHFHPLCS